MQAPPPPPPQQDQAASTAAAAAFRPTQQQQQQPPSSHNNIQALRTLFRVLTDVQFESEVVRERQRRESSRPPNKSSPTTKASIRSSKRKRAPPAAAAANDDDDDSAVQVAPHHNLMIPTAATTTTNHSSITRRTRKRQKRNHDSAGNDETGTTNNATATMETTKDSSPVTSPRQQQQQQQQSPPKGASAAANQNVETTAHQQPNSQGVRGTASSTSTTARQKSNRRLLHVPPVFANGLFPVQVNNHRDSNNNNKKGKSSSSSQTTSSSNHHVQQWDDMYRQLQDYKAMHGHINVPCSNNNEWTKLYKWVSKQKIQWKAALEGKRSILNQHNRIQRLVDIGMSLRPSGNSRNGIRSSTTTTTSQASAASTASAAASTTTASGPNNNATIWEERFQDLVLYKKQHGHTDLRRHRNKNDKHYQALARWCETQRANYRNRHSKATTGKKRDQHAGVLSGSDEDKLRSIGFKFELSKRFSFADRFAMISQYKAIHGNTLVPIAFTSPDFPGLGHWVSNTKKQFHGGKLSSEREAKLKSIDFDFSNRCAPNGGYKNKDNRNNNNDSAGGPSAAATTDTTTTGTNGRRSPTMEEMMTIGV